MLDFKNYELN